jgi:transposase
MPTPRRSFDKEFKLQVLREIEAGSSVAQAARVHGVHPELIYRWKQQLRKYGERSLAGLGNAYTDEARIAQLERTLGQMAAENALLKKAIKTLQELQRSNGVRRSSR